MPVLQITGASMEPTLEDGQFVIALKNDEFEAGDITAFYYNNKILIKRVIANQGDWVNIDMDGNVFVNGIFWVAGGLLYALLKDGKIRLPDRSVLGFSALSGLFVLGIVFFMAQSLALAKASIVLPIAQMSFLGTLTLSAIFLKERLTFPKILGILCGIAAILLLSL
jgi:uncharacterized membrane protein